MRESRENLSVSKDALTLSHAGWVGVYSGGMRLNFGICRNLVMVLLAGESVCGNGPGAPNQTSSQRVVLDIPLDCDLTNLDDRKAFAVSEDGSNVALVRKQGTSCVVYLNGVVVTRGFDEVTALSLRGNHLSFRGARQGKQFLIVDGKTNGPFDMVEGAMWATDAPVYAAEARLGKDFCMIVNGHQLAGFWQYCSLPRLSSDGRHCGFVGQKGGRYYVVIDGQESEPYESVTGIWFSAGDFHYAYEARIGAREIKGVFVDGKRVSAPSEGAYSPRFSPSGSRFGYKVMKEQRESLVCDGRVVCADASMIYPQIWSRNSKHWMAVIERQENGKKVKRLCADGVEGATAYLDVAAGCDISDDGHYAAWAKRADQDWVLIRDGTETAEHSSKGGYCMFGGAGKHLAVLKRTGDKEQLLMDGISVGAPVDGLSVAFVGNGAKIAGIAQHRVSYYNNYSLWSDGSEVGPFENSETGVVASSPGEVFAIFRNGRKLIRAALVGRKVAKADLLISNRAR
jgi:hypothetical protein